MNLGSRTLNSLLTYYNTGSLARKAHNGKLIRTLQNLADSGVLGQSLGIDEVSMMEAEQLDIITSAMNRAFNGRRGIVLTGDFAQLPPVEGQFAFEADCWPQYEKNMVVLDKIWRQHDEKFLNALALIRRGDAIDGARALVESGAEFRSASDVDFDGVTLVPTNDEADSINGRQAAKLPGLNVFVSERKGKEAPEWKLIPPATVMKPGCRVMVTANEPNGLHVNGDLGTFIEQVGKNARVRLDRDGLEILITPITRKNIDYTESSQGKWIGEITFMPLKLAYALTIHKSQGLTLPRVQLHVEHWFAKSPALIYVACSRVREANNLFIVGSSQQLAAKITAHPGARRWL